MIKMGTKWQKGYEMACVRIDHHIIISYPVDLGTKWPKLVRNDLGTKWLLLGTKWPKGRYEMTKVGTKWPGYEMTGNLPVYEYDYRISVCNSEDRWSVCLHRCSVVPTHRNERHLSSVRRRDTKGACPSTFSSTAIELNLKKNDR